MESGLTLCEVKAGGLGDGACRLVVLVDLRCSVAGGWCCESVTVGGFSLLRRIVSGVALAAVSLGLGGTIRCLS